MPKSTKHPVSRAHRAPSPDTADPIALYLRVSTDDQADRDTVAVQDTFLRNLAATLGRPIADVYSDDGVSGKIPFHERPEGRRLLADADAGRFGTVYVMRVSRFARDQQVGLTAYEALKARGILLRSGTEPMEPETLNGMFVFQLLLSVAQLDHGTIADNTSRGRVRVAGTGRHTGGPIPIGYDVDERGTYVLSARAVPQLACTEAEMIRDIYVRLAAGQTTLHAEVLRLNALGIPRVKRYALSVKRRKEGKEASAKENGTGWWYSSLRWVIKNPHYKGEGTLASGDDTITRPVPALVDAQTWERAQQTLIRNRRFAKKNAKHAYPLRGLITCGVCGATYTGAAQVGSRRYRCHGGSKQARALPEGRCWGKQVSAERLEADIWAHCERFVLNPGEYVAETQRRLRERMTDATNFAERRRETLALLAEKETERERALTQHRKGWATDEETERQLDAVSREAGQLREELESLRAQAALLDSQEAQLAEDTVLLAELRHVVEEIKRTGDEVAKAGVMARLVRRIVIKTRRGEGRWLQAQAYVYLRLRHEAIVIEDSTLSPTDKYSLADVEIEVVLVA